MTSEVPDLPDSSDDIVFDDSWVAAAQHRERSARALETRRRWAELDADRERRERAAVRAARWRRVRMRALQLMFVAACAAVVYVAVVRGDDQPASADRADALARSLVGDTERPTPTDGAGHRLSPEMTADPAATSFAFLATANGFGDPVSYDPCRPISVVVAAERAPTDWHDIVDGALADIAAASGLTFELQLELTDERPSTVRRPYQPDRYGDRWAPVLIAWTDPATEPQLVGTIAGVGGSTAVDVGVPGAYYVTGEVLLDGPQLAERSDSGEGRDLTRSVLLHELGHVLGLDHVEDRSQIMHAESTVTELGDGDRAGLARLGAGRCAPAL